MTVREFAISVPEDVMHEVDVAAKSRKLTRSAFISLVLRRVASAGRDAEIRRRINHVMLDPETAEEILDSARHFARARRDRDWEW